MCDVICDAFKIVIKKSSFNLRIVKILTLYDYFAMRA
jgi:hypothetical protein